MTQPKLESIAMKAQVVLKGASPLLMHRPVTEDFLKELGIFKGTHPTQEQEALAGAYWRGNKPNTELIIPANCFIQSFINASKMLKTTGRKSMSGNFINSCPLITPLEIGLGKKEYVVDTQTVVLQGKNRIPRSRARVDDWTATFSIEWDGEFVSDHSMEEIMNTAGRRVGILDYRPQKKGFNGRYVVEKFELLKGR